MTGLETRFERIELPLAEPFTISRGTTGVAENVLVEIDGGDHVGVGGAGPSGRYGETPESAVAALPDLLGVVENVGDPHALARIEGNMREAAPGEAAARSAVSIPLHDLVAKRLDLALYRSLGLDPDAVPATSVTIGIDDLAALDVEFVEQPGPAGDPAGLARIGERAALPVAADESCRLAADVPDVAGWADVAVVKLAKTGGIREAVRAIHAARAHGLEVMLGCMVASNAALAGACHLGPMAEYADLDGSLLLGRDPFAGIAMPGGHIDLGGVGRPGTGAYRE